MFLSLVSISFATSPSFVRQEIYDGDQEWTFYNITEKGKPQTFDRDDMGELTGSFVGHINSVSYVSDGETFNTTFFLSTPFNNTINSKLNNTPAYYVYIDSDLNSKTGYNGIDYIQGLIWDEKTKSWKVQLNETSYKPTRLNKVQRVIDEYNYTQNTKGNNYVFLSLNLKLLNYPPQYRIIFFAQDDITNKTSGKIEHIFDSIRLFDSLNTVIIPSPEFKISTTPSEIKLSNIVNSRSVDITMNSTKSFSSLHGLLPQINFETNYPCSSDGKIKSNYKISLCFTPNPVNISSDGFGFTSSTIKISPALSEGTQIIPITANISYPSDSLLSPLNNAEPNPIQKIKQIIYLSIVVESPLEQFKDWLDDILNPIAAGVTTIIGVTTAIVGALAGLKIRKKKGKKEKDID